MKAAPLPPLSDGATFCDGPDGGRLCTGSQMGRANVLPSDPAQRSARCKLRLVRLRWVSGDYDPAGAYWGATRRYPYHGPGMAPALDWIFRAVGNVGDVRAEVFTRARDRATARAAVAVLLPGARFYR